MHTFLIMLVLFLPPAGSDTNRCSCRPDIPADAQGQGTCSVVQQGSKWCQFTYSGSGEKGSTFDQTDLERAKSWGVDGDQARAKLGFIPPQKWDNEFIRAFVPSMLRDSLPTRNLGDEWEKLSKVLKDAPPQMLRALNTPSSAPQSFQLGDYSAKVSFGCIDMSEIGSHEIRIRIKSPYAESKCGGE